MQKRSLWTSLALLIFAGMFSAPVPDDTVRVEYYAQLERPVLGGEKSLSFIDCSGALLPKNGAEHKMMSLALEQSEEGYVIKTEEELCRIYSEAVFPVEKISLEQVDKLRGNMNYVLESIELCKGEKRISYLPEMWEDLSRLVAVGDTLRLNYGPTQSIHSSEADFYDYNIAAGMTYEGAWNTECQGINSPENYSSSGVKLVFGSESSGAGLWAESFEGKRINANEEECCFSMVTALRGDGPVFSSGLAYPPLFGDDAAIGKHDYPGGRLQFTRTGDSYELSSAQVSGAGRAESLESFTEYGGKFSNNFWPMDGAVNRTDLQWGKAGEEIFHSAGKFRQSDDGKEHNWFFGLSGEIEFELDAEYCGPLECYVYSDDDFWIFLDGRLIGDLGGIHAAQGQHIDLWGYMPSGSSGQHRLSFFSLERGGATSTCYMRFTVPNVENKNFVV